MPLDRHPMRRSCALIGLACLAFTTPVAAQPFTRTIANGETVVVPRSLVYGLPAGESLLIELGGELQGRGSVIGLGGQVQVNGRLRAFKGSENSTAVGVSGQLTSSATGLLEITHLTVQSGGMVSSAGSLLLGGFRLNPTDPLTTVCATQVPCPETGFQIDNGGLITVASSAPMLNYGNAQISGNLYNAGAFVSRNSTNTSGGVAYRQTLNVGTDPLFGGGSGQLQNIGDFVLEQRNTLRNFGIVANSGTMTLAGGTLQQEAQGALLNTGNLVIGTGGQLTMAGSKTLDPFGNRVARVINQGRIHVGDGGTLHNNWLLRVDTLASGPAQLTVGTGGMLTQDGDAVLAIVRGDMLVQGSVTGGTITLDGSVFGGNAGSLTIAKGGSVSVQDYMQTDGVLTVNGVLTGQVQLTGGNLMGGGAGSRINGDVFFAGAGGGPPQAPPHCGNAFYACFRPGNSPGHMDIDGTLQMGANSLLELEVQRDAAGVLHWDSVSATSMNFDGASLRLLVADGAAGADWLNLDLLQCQTDCSFGFGFGSIEVVGAAGAGFVQFGDGRLWFALAPVPEPASASLLVAGLGLLGWRRFGSRRQSRSSAL